MPSETEQDEDCRGQPARFRTIHPCRYAGSQRKRNEAVVGQSLGGSAGMPREMTDEEGITWTCIQAFAGLGNDPEKADAARVEGSEGKVRVVCTPSGAARSVRIACPADWETSMQDERLLSAIQEALAQAEQAT